MAEMTERQAIDTLVLVIDEMDKKARGLDDVEVYTAITAVGQALNIALNALRNVPGRREDAARAIIKCRNCAYWSGRRDPPGTFTAIGYCDHPNHHIMPLNAGFYCAHGTIAEEEK